ncbi:MAG: hypothetical protein HOJ79_16295 [Nitrospina sp.]|jgi:hypothetical protein|nr:hypothetical protein [Nitrospina sp.]
MTAIEKSDALPKRFKFSKAMAWLFLFSSFYMLMYTYWRSEIVNMGVLRAYYDSFYLIGSLGALFWIIVLRLRDEVRLNLVIASISLIVGVYAVEILLSFTYPMSTSNRFAAQKAGVAYDTRNAWEVVRDLRKKGVDAIPYPLHPVGDTSFYPFGSVSGKTAVVYNETGKYMVIQSDRYGFNNPDSVWDSKTIDWGLIGDSFTFGLAVQSGEDIGSQIRNLTNSSVINFGRPGIGPLLQLAGLKEYVEPKAPKRVLWMYWEGNDLHNLISEKENSLLMKYLQPGFSQDLIHRQDKVDAFFTNRIQLADSKVSKKVEPPQEEVGQSMLSNPFRSLITEARAHTAGLRHEKKAPSALLRLVNLRNHIGLQSGDSGFKKTIEIGLTPLFIDILTLARDRVTEHGGELYFVYLPRAQRYLNFMVDHDAYAKRGEVLNAVRSLGIPVIDTHQEVFVNHQPDPLNLFPFRMRNHYNAEGYRLVAKAIVERVEEIQ